MDFFGLFPGARPFRPPPKQTRWLGSTPASWLGPRPSICELTLAGVRPGVVHRRRPPLTLAGVRPGALRRLSAVIAGFSGLDLDPKKRAPSASAPCREEIARGLSPSPSRPKEATTTRKRWEHPKLQSHSRTATTRKRTKTQQPGRPGQRCRQEKTRCCRARCRQQRAPADRRVPREHERFRY